MFPLSNICETRCYFWKSCTPTTGIKIPYSWNVTSQLPTISTKINTSCCRWTQRTTVTQYCFKMVYWWSWYGMRERIIWLNDWKMILWNEGQMMNEWKNQSEDSDAAGFFSKAKVILDGNVIVVGHNWVPYLRCKIPELLEIVYKRFVRLVVCMIQYWY